MCLPSGLPSSPPPTAFAGFAVDDLENLSPEEMQRKIEGSAFLGAEGTPSVPLGGGGHSFIQPAPPLKAKGGGMQSKWLKASKQLSFELQDNPSLLTSFQQ